MRLENLNNGRKFRVFDRDSGGFDAAQDENAVMFTNKQQPGFEWAKELIDRYVEAARSGIPTTDR